MKQLGDNSFSFFNYCYLALALEAVFFIILIN